MQLAILFMFHAHSEVCRNRVARLRADNPGSRIYGLCLADHGLPQSFEAWAPDAFDDLFLLPEGIPGIWKWARAEALVQLWHGHRGGWLDWDRLAIVHWDQLIFGGIEEQLADLAPDQLYFCGLRPLEGAVLARWEWSRRFSFFRAEFERFEKLVRERYGYQQPLLGSLSIFSVVTRRFLDALLQEADTDSGFGEYSLPTLARCLGFSIHDRDLGVAWDALDPVAGKPMNAIGLEIDDAYIREELVRDDGWRFFHPCYRLWAESGGGGGRDGGASVPTYAPRPANTDACPAVPTDLRVFLEVLRIPEERLHGLMDMFAKLCTARAPLLERMDPDFYLGRHLGKSRLRRIGIVLRELGKSALTALADPARFAQRCRMLRAVLRKL